ncbi:hypothetical protein ScPMuIL_011249 [Solemya velum]
MFATVVHVYKFVENQYASQGKLGAAVLGSPTTKYHILLYITKQKQVSSATIFPAFKLVVQANNYANFYDDARQNWSLMFDTEANAIQFAKQVALAKANSSGQSLDSLISQDLTPGEGGALETGDSVEVRYTGWLLTDNALGQVFDTNTNAEKLFRFRVGKGKVIKGWDSGVIGMKKGGKRLLIVPPSMGYGAQAMGSKIPPNSTLVFEIEVVRVKLSKADSPQVSPAPTPVPNNLPALDSDGGEDITVKERSRSISEQMSHSPKTDKAKLISRMAKMGKPMLPLSGAVAAQTDSDDDSVPASPKPQTATKPVLQPEVYPTTQPVGQPTAQFVGQPIAQPVGQPIGQPVPQVPSYPVEQVFSQPMSQPAFLQNMPGAQQLAVFQPQNFLQQQQQQAAMLQQQLQCDQYSDCYHPGAGNPPADINTPVLLSETRQQNTEVRLSLGKVSDKMDRIMEKIEHLESHNMNQLALQPSAPTMETSVLLFNIQRLVQENERLKKDVFDKGSKIESQNEKISELLQKNQVYVEKSQTLLEERNEGFKNTANQSQAKVLSLEQEKQETTSLREKLRRQKTSKDSASAEQVAQLEQELAQEWKQKSDKLLATAHEKHSRALQEMQDEKTDLFRKNQELEKKVQSLRSSTGSSEVQISALQDQLDDMSMWKDKYENLRNQATSMKERYEDRLKQMAEAQEQAETDRDQMAFEKDRFVERVKQLQQQLQQQETQIESLQAAQQTPAKPTVVPSVVDEVKKIMNTVYRQIRGEFETDESYTGSEILTVILNTIKTTTLSLVKRQTSEVSTIEESEEDSDEEEEENQTQESENNTTEASFPMDMSENKSSETFIKIDVPSTETFTPLDIPSSEPSETFPPVDTLSLEQATEPMKSNDASIIGEIEGPMKSVDIQSTEQNTEPMKSVEIQNTEHKTEPIKSIDSVTEQIEQPIKSVDIHNTEETEPIESVEESPEPSTESFTPVDINSSEQLERQLTITVGGPVQSLDGEKVKRVEDEEDMFSAVEDNDIQSDPEMKPDSVTEPTTAQLIEQVNENTNSNSLDNNDQPDDRLVNESLNNQSNGRIDNNIENKQSSDELVPEIKDDQSRSRSSTQDVESISDPLLIEPPEIKEEQSRSRSSTQDVESISDPLLMEPPPLEEKSDDSPLFGDDDMVEDMFGTDFKQKEVEVEEEEEEKPAKTSSKQMSKPELSEDEMKPKPPPPLFSDDDDDDDLDWLNS